MSAAKERGGCQFWRGSAEEAAGGGGIVRSGPLSIHFHPGPCSQDQRTAPTAKELIRERTHKDWKRHEYFILNKVLSRGEKTINETTKHFTLCDFLRIVACGVILTSSYLIKFHAPVVSHRWG